jgi:hypothetical protein
VLSPRLIRNWLTRLQFRKSSDEQRGSLRPDCESLPKRLLRYSQKKPYRFKFGISKETDQFFKNTPVSLIDPTSTNSPSTPNNTPTLPSCPGCKTIDWRSLISELHRRRRNHNWEDRSHDAKRGLDVPIRRPPWTNSTQDSTTVSECAICALITGLEREASHDGMTPSCILSADAVINSSLGSDLKTKYALRESYWTDWYSA